jgi:prophage antirepressor-like protein
LFFKIQKKGELLMTKLTIYLFGYEETRGLITRPYDGSSWYMAARICDLLCISGYSQAVQKHLSDHEWRKEPIYIGGYGKKKVLLVSEVGMIKLIKRGRTEYAQQVQDRARQTPDRLKTQPWPTELFES